jgi:hypothetical protein
MRAFPKLSPKAMQLLGIILDHSQLPGGELMRHAGMKLPEDLLEPVKELQANDLIDVSGDISDAYRVPFAVFGARPSSRDYLYQLLKQQRSA